MAGPDGTAVVEDPRFALHRGPSGHPERPERLEAVRAALEARRAECCALEPREALEAELLRIHTPAHLRQLQAAAARAPVLLDADTYLGPDSLAVARLAAGSAIDLACAVASGRWRNGFAALRPPGHHAESARAMGFCLLNHVALAARALIDGEGLERVLIVDWDVHHGNGTQHSFEEDPRVFFFSTHQFPFYPGSGRVDEIGRGAGRGTTLNLPLPEGCGDAEYRALFARVLAPAARHFRPQMILVSCGFDAHREDPLGGMRLSGAGFGEIARCVRGLAEELCDGRLVLSLEGGYAQVGLREGCDAVLDALLGPPPPPPEGGAAEHPLPPVLEDLLRRLGAAQGAPFQGL